MSEKESNIREIRRMLEYIAERTGEDRASVFLDIIIQMVSAGDEYSQQQLINRIAEIYKIHAPTLKTGPGGDDIPF